MFSALEVQMLMHKPRRLVACFPCGHRRIPSNALAFMVDGEMRIRCRACRNRLSREYRARKTAASQEL